MRFIRGADGRGQARKLAAWICFVPGIVLLVRGTYLPPDAGIESEIVPAVVALVFLSPFQRMALYAVAILAVGFGIEWGFSYIFEAHSGRRAKKKSLSEGLPWGARPRSPARARLSSPLSRRRGHSKEGR